MPILGLLLVLAAAGLAVDVVAMNTAPINVDAVGTSLSLSPGWLFVAGIAAGVVAVAGLGLATVGLKRMRRRRTEMVESRRSVEDLRAERDRLAVELERERERAGRTPTPADIDVSDERRTEPAEHRDGREAVGSGRAGRIQRRS